MTNNKTKGFLLGAIAAASYGMNPLFTLPLYSAGMSVDSVLFYRYALAIVVLGIMMKMQKQSFAIKKADVLPLCIMGLLFSFSSLFLFMSYNYMDAGIASTILFVNRPGNGRFSIFLSVAVLYGFFSSRMFLRHMTDLYGSCFFLPVSHSYCPGYLSHALKPENKTDHH